MLETLTTSQDSDGNIVAYNVTDQKAGIAFVCFDIFFFASTLGPLAWAITDEIYILRTRARSLFIATATNISHPRSHCTHTPLSHHRMKTHEVKQEKYTPMK
ncbi:hypothetical protein F4779DRAFT_607520 [Xylariaceae sp. FL0662B]|nr:hypothetical protein F4779DRAFT_607520 [Xylariaceae sp. FL0662B]